VSQGAEQLPSVPPDSNQLRVSNPVTAEAAGSSLSLSAITLVI